MASAGRSAGRSFSNWSIRGPGRQLPAPSCGAARAGERFDTDTGLPELSCGEPGRVTWFDLPAYMDLKWPRAAAEDPELDADSLATVTPVLVTTARGMARRRGAARGAVPVGLSPGSREGVQLPVSTPPRCPGWEGRCRSPRWMRRTGVALSGRAGCAASAMAGRAGRHHDRPKRAVFHSVLRLRGRAGRAARQPARQDELEAARGRREGRPPRGRGPGRSASCWPRERRAAAAGTAGPAADGVLRLPVLREHAA